MSERARDLVVSSSRSTSEMVMFAIGREARLAERATTTKCVHAANHATAMFGAATNFSGDGHCVLIKLSLSLSLSIPPSLPPSLPLCLRP